MDEVILLAESCLEVVYFQNPILRQFGACKKLWTKHESVGNGICLSKCKKKKSELPLEKNLNPSVFSFKMLVSLNPISQNRKLNKLFIWILKYIYLPQNYTLTFNKHQLIL